MVLKYNVHFLMVACPRSDLTRDGLILSEVIGPHLIRPIPDDSKYTFNNKFNNFMTQFCVSHRQYS